MKKSFLTTASVLIALVVFSGEDAQSQTLSAKPQWHSDYQKAVRQAKEKDVPLWIHFYSNS